jgi:hypothetical protein
MHSPAFLPLPVSRSTFRRRSRSAVCLLACCLVTFAPRNLRAVGQPVPEGFEPGVLPAAAALFPGLLLHGAGHWAAGDRDTAWNLLLAEGIGLGMMLTGISALAYTGADKRFSAPSISLIAAGLGLFTASWLADLLGAAGVPHGAPGPDPGVQVRLGYGRISDPLFRYENLALVSAAFRSGRMTITPFFTTALDDDNRQAGLRLAWRLLKRRTGNNGYLDIEAAGSHHDYGSRLFSTWTGEGSLVGRYDLGQFAGSLAGAFAGFSLGWGLARYTYGIPGAAAVSDTHSLLLIRATFGLWLGTAGELELYYDHRRDGYAGALGGTGIGSGALGSVGLRFAYALDGAFGINVEAVAGSALLLGMGVEWRR